MTTKASNIASANRRRIFFNLYGQRVQENQEQEKNIIQKNDTKKVVCFWTDEQYVSER